MNVHHFLVCIGPVVLKHVVRCRTRHLHHRPADSRQDAPDRRGRIIRERIQSRRGLLGNDQRMPFAQRADVQKRQDMLVLVHLVAGDLAVDDLGEDGGCGVWGHRAMVGGRRRQMASAGGVGEQYNDPMEVVERVRRPIQILPALLVNQIAAGEVVERPASIVKELIDNSIDAKADRIRLEIEQGGIELVRVSDDGAGIPQDEMLLALSPHATNKIEAAADLDRIATMGFRGEALASIASVARVAIRSRTADETGASLIEAEGDTVLAVRPASGSVGTVVTVRNIFFNTPARRKFLRTARTEQIRCMSIVRDLALSHPGIAFEAVCDGKKSLDLPPNQSVRDRGLAILGKELAEQLLEINTNERQNPGVSMWGLVGLPTIARATNKSQHIFINGRPIRDKTIQHALREAYRGLIEPGRHPTAVLMLEMDPGAVDVNVHPTKAEVRFRDSSFVHQLVLHTVREALRGADLTPTVFAARPSLLGRGDTEILPAQPMPTAQTRQADTRAFVDYFKRIEPSQGGQRFDYESIRDAITNEASSSTESEESGEQQPAGAPDPTGWASPRPAPTHLQIQNSFIVTQDEQGVVIIDQHALHERVMFEALLARIGDEDLESQRLLTPVIIPINTAQADHFESLGPLLTRIGIDAQLAGPQSLAIHSFATILFDRGVDPLEFMTELIEKAEDESFSADSEEALRDVLDMMSCKAAVKAGDQMSELELVELMKLREAVDRSSNCPHGRPTTVRLTIRDLERLFGRS